MSSFVKMWRARQNGEIKPGKPVPGSGKTKAHRRQLKMRPYERPRPGGGRHSTDND